MKIAIIGGTGPEGSGLGFRWAAAGHEVIIGSRRAEKGQQVAAELLALEPDFPIRGMDNLAAVTACDVAVLAVPYGAQAATLAGLQEALAGKLLITVVAPTGEKASVVYRLPSGLSAAEEAQQQLGDAVRVVAAFQNIGAHHLRDLDHEMDCDVLVCGQKAVDKDVAMRLAQDAGLRGVNAGSLQNAGVVEGLTSLLIFMNIKYKVKAAGIRIAGISP
ncbi:MAG: NADPH-dependent F420 reductase [Anaerolineales bacterium]|nr:NADPH-dependent F420 reductase [Anaerolineales bacterium]MCB8953629.1 NADPH-dependent F420 reductase [Ardenticatenales bacterium]